MLPRLVSLLAFSGSTLAAALPDITYDERYLVRRALKTGQGTRYGDGCTEEDCWQDGACSFVDYKLPPGIDGSTCVSEQIWDNGANCGGCISVEYKGKKLTIMVTNKTGGGANHLDMTPDTWSKLTNGMSGGGVDGIKWDWVTCPISTPLEIKMHNGANKYAPSATVLNAKERTSKLEWSDDNGSSWKAGKRTSYNAFDGDTLNSETAWVKVTSESGAAVTVKNVELTSGKVTKADKNYS